MEPGYRIKEPKAKRNQFEKKSLTRLGASAVSREKQGTRRECGGERGKREKKKGVSAVNLAQEGELG